MVTEGLTKYIKEESSRGVSKDAIRTALVKNGWTLPDIEDGFKAVFGESITPPPAPQAAPAVINTNPFTEKKQSPEIMPKPNKKFSLLGVTIDLTVIIIVLGTVYFFGDKINSLILPYLKSAQSVNEMPATIPSGQNPIDTEFSTTSGVADTSDHSSADFVVAGINVSPVSPKINDKDVQIVVTIKNVGKTTSGAQWIKASGEIEGSVYQPVESNLPGGIKPGGQAMWIWRPFSQPTKTSSTDNNVDTPGIKTVKIILNPDKSVTETDYTNDTLTKTFEFVQ